MEIDEGKNIGLFNLSPVQNGIVRNVGVTEASIYGNAPVWLTMLVDW